MLDLSTYAAPALPSDRVTSVAAFTQEFGGNLERIGTIEKFLMLLSILDYLGTTDPTYSMQNAVCFQDGDGHLSAGIDEDSPEHSIAEWLQHFTTLAQEAESNELLWGIAATLFEQLRQGCE